MHLYIYIYIPERDAIVRKARAKTVFACKALLSILKFLPEIFFYKNLKVEKNNLEVECKKSKSY